jgi:hypothetical protein
LKKAANVGKVCSCSTLKNDHYKVTFFFCVGILKKIQDWVVTLTCIEQQIKIFICSWKTMADKRKILVESYDICAKRIQYLKQLQRYVHEERPIVYTDESYIHSSHSQSKSWTDDSVLGLKKPISKGKILK